jgi:energy-coupling factor transport system substrate-specific component
VRAKSHEGSYLVISNERADSSWRTVDIVVAAVIAVAFGVVFWAWGLAWNAWAPFFGGGTNPPLYLISGVWLMPAVLGALVIRKPGAGIFTEALAAVISALIGSVWGLDTVASGIMQGAGAELVFALILYRSFGLPVAVLAAAGAAAGEWIHDMAFYYQGTAFDIQLTIGAFMLVSAVVIAGIGSWLLTRALAQTGVLALFPSGGSQRPV